MHETNLNTGHERLEQSAKSTLLGNGVDLLQADAQNLKTINSAFSINSNSETQVTKGTVSLPVFYVTDRQWNNTKHAFTEDRNTDRHRSQDLAYGIAKISMPVKSPLPLNYAERGWKLNDKLSTEPKIEKLDPKTYPQFAKELPSFSTNSNSKDVVLYIHGFRNDFDKAAKMAGTMSEVLEKPVVMYSWPTGGKAGYSTSENNVEWSSRHFQILLLQLKKQLGADHISVVSHSMGNRLIKWAAHDDSIFAQGYKRGAQDAIAEQEDLTQQACKVASDSACQSVRRMVHPELDVPKFKEIDLISPDVDRGAFKNDWGAIAKDTDKARIFISSKDKAMQISTWLAGHPRAGLQENSDKWDYPAAIEGTQTIDFSEVDKPYFKSTSWLPDIGHHIPLDLLKNLHNTDTPGAGLLLEKKVKDRGLYFKVEPAKHQ